MDGLCGKYPIIIDGEDKGELIVSNEGAMTLFRARCVDTGGLLRLSVYGDSEGYLGVMQPVDGECVLNRRMSRAALRSFPRSISYAGEAGGLAAAGEEKAKKANENKTEEKLSQSDDNSDLEWQLMANPSALFADIETRITFQKSQGVLISKQKDKLLIAVPLSGNINFPALPVYSGGDTRVIEGRQYAVFELKNGKII